MILADHRIYYGDFFRKWQVVADHSVDLLLTDPPFGILRPAQEWDYEQDLAVLSWIADQLLRPTGQIAIFSSGKMITAVVQDLRKYFEFRYPEVWLKPSAMVSHKDRPRPDIEFVLVFHRRGTKKINRTFNWRDIALEGESYIRRNVNRRHTTRTTLKRPVDVNESGLRYPSSVMEVPNRPAMKKAEREVTDHPCQKSLAQVERLIRLLSHRGQVVLDAFMGSGTTIVAAARSGRVGIGFERDRKFFNQARQRIEHELEENLDAKA